MCHELKENRAKNETEIKKRNVYSDYMVKYTVNMILIMTSRKGKEYV